MNFIRPLAISCALIFFQTTGAAAFGLLDHEDTPSAEHERITRAALVDISPRTLDALAGRRGTLGAIGWPDIRLALSARAHCDGGDFLSSPPAPTTPTYPQTRQEAQSHLVECQQRIFEQLDMAVAAAAPLANPTAFNTATNCIFNGVQGRAKCNVLEHLGLAMHAAQDFYSHTNWSDEIVPRPTAANPPGLGNTGRASWLDPRNRAASFPPGLISGCFTFIPEGMFCNYSNYDRVRHEVLNKDTGPIGGSGATGTGTTPRSAGNQNFQRAVSAAIDDTRDKWLYFQERVIATYGEEAGRRIICVVRSDSHAQC